MSKRVYSIILILFFCVFTVLSAKAAQMTVSTSPHWKSGVITVYLPPSSTFTRNKYGKQERVEKPYYARLNLAMTHAFQKWQSQSFGKLNFKFVGKEPAQIKVVYTDKIDGSDGPIGICNLSIQGPYITSAEIRINSDAYKNYSNDLVYTTMLHEVGHALGLNHNTRKYRSIMHFPITEDLDILSIDVEKIFKLNQWAWGQRRIKQN